VRTAQFYGLGRNCTSIADQDARSTLNRRAHSAGQADCLANSVAEGPDELVPPAAQVSTVLVWSECALAF
jgi:hypothetical protein